MKVEDLRPQGAGWRLRLHEKGGKHHAIGGDVLVPAIVASAGPRASRRFLEFFAVTIENPNTRAAYFHACRRFFAWCEHKGLDELAAIEPMHVAAYVRALGKDFEKPT